MASEQRDAGKESLWRETLQRQVASGLSVRAFCRQGADRGKLLRLAANDSRARLRRHAIRASEAEKDRR
jgi:hypothetical protein